MPAGFPQTTDNGFGLERPPRVIRSLDNLGTPPISVSSPRLRKPPGHSSAYLAGTLECPRMITDCECPTAPEPYRTYAPNYS